MGVSGALLPTGPATVRKIPGTPGSALALALELELGARLEL